MTSGILSGLLKQANGTVEPEHTLMISAASYIGFQEILIKDLSAALRGMVYETTHLSPEEADGSHWCRIPKQPLQQARLALLQLEKIK